MVIINEEEFLNASQIVGLTWPESEKEISFEIIIKQQLYAQMMDWS